MDLNQMLGHLATYSKVYQGKGSCLGYVFNEIKGQPILVIEHKLVLEFALGKKLKEKLIETGRKNTLLKEACRKELQNTIAAGIGKSYIADVKVATMQDKTTQQRFKAGSTVKTITLRHGLIQVNILPATHSRPIDENVGIGIVESVTRAVYSWRNELLTAL